MTSLIDRLIPFLLKPATFLFRYLRQRPNIELTIDGTKSLQGSGKVTGTLHFKWSRTFIFHNDSSYISRGIKLISPIPHGWNFESDFPTRLEPDERFKIPIVIECEKDSQQLSKDFGNMRSDFAPIFFPVVLSAAKMEIEFKNQHGRTFHQRFRFDGEGKVISEAF